MLQLRKGTAEGNAASPCDEIDASGAAVLAFLATSPLTCSSLQCRELLLLSLFVRP